MHCQPYTCYQKSPYFSSCRKDAPPDSWDGAVLGGGRTHRSLAPAGSQVALQGTSLYCFSVVNWAAPPPQPFWSSEADLAKNIRENGVGIMQCDDHDWFDGSPTAKAAQRQARHVPKPRSRGSPLQHRRVLFAFSASMSDLFWSRL